MNGDAETDKQVDEENTTCRCGFLSRGILHSMKCLCFSVCVSRDVCVFVCSAWKFPRCSVFAQWHGNGLFVLSELKTYRHGPGH